MDDILKFDDLALRVSDSRLFTSAELAQKARPVESFTGVYFLVKEGEVVYVGQGVNVYTRVGDHKRDKDFDSWCFVPVPRERLDAVESLYIHFLQPRLNGRYHPNHKSGGGFCAPLSLKDLLGRCLETT